MVFMMDNASNNNTLINEIVTHVREQNITMNNEWVCFCCMPHTVHLAVLKVNIWFFHCCNIIIQLFEGIKAITAAEYKKATLQSGNYQESVTAPLSQTSDNDAAGKDDENKQVQVLLKVDGSDSILSAVEKIGDLILASGNPLTSFCSFEKSSAPYKQTLNANKAGSSK